MDDTDAFCTNETSMYMENYIDRLKTFEHWSPQIQPNKYQLASCGLYYLGQHDRCKCFRCGIVLYHWKSTDDAFLEHHKHSPNCQFLRMVGPGTRLLIDT